MESRAGHVGSLAVKNARSHMIARVVRNWQGCSRLVFALREAPRVMIAGVVRKWQGCSCLVFALLREAVMIADANDR